MLRFGLPVALAGGELLALSLAIDLPLHGPGLGVAGTLRLALPVAVGAVVAAWLLSRATLRVSLERLEATLPPWRPAVPLALHTLAVAGTAALVAWTEDGRPRGALDLGALSASAALALALALRTAGPLRALVAPALRAGAVPVVSVALATLAWRVASAAEGLWAPLSGAMLSASAAVLSWAGGKVEIIPEEQYLALGDFAVTIAPVCSGIDGVGLVLVFLAAWLSLGRGRLRFPHALLAVPVGCTLALLANLVRICVLMGVGAGLDPALALGAFHSKLGWVLYALVAIGTVAFAERTGWLVREDLPAGDSGLGVAAAAYLTPLLATLAAAAVAGLLARDGFDTLYGVRAAAGAAALAAVARRLPRFAISPSIAAILIGVAVGAAWVALLGAPAPSPPALDAWAPGARWAWFAARVVGSCVVVPWVEELAFRGFLMRWLVSEDFERVRPPALTWSAVLLSAAAFGALHQHWLLGACAGAAYAAAWRIRGRLADAVLAHATSNACIAAAVLGLEHWSLWS